MPDLLDCSHAVPAPVGVVLRRRIWPGDFWIPRDAPQNSRIIGLARQSANRLDCDGVLDFSAAPAGDLFPLSPELQTYRCVAANSGTRFRLQLESHTDHASRGDRRARLIICVRPLDFTGAASVSRDKAAVEGRWRCRDMSDTFTSTLKGSPEFGQ